MVIRFGFLLAGLIALFLLSSQSVVHRYRHLLLLLLIATDLLVHARSIRWDQPHAVYWTDNAAAIHDSLRQRKSEIELGAAFRFSAMNQLRRKMNVYANDSESDPILEMAKITVNRLMPNVPLYYGFHDIYGTGLLRPADKMKFLMSFFQSNPDKFMDTTGVYYTSELPRGGVASFPIRINRNATPYTFIPGKVRFYTTDNNILELVLDNRFVPQTDIFVESGFTKRHLEQKQAAVAPERTDGQTLYLQVPALSTGSFVFVNETFHRNWHAYRAENKLTVRKANGWAMAIQVDDGCRQGCRITLRYQNIYITIGMVVSVLTALLCMLALFWPRQKSRLAG